MPVTTDDSITTPRINQVVPTANTPSRKTDVISFSTITADYIIKMNDFFVFVAGSVSPLV